MGELQLSGLATGIDTTAIITQLMAVEKTRLQGYQADKIEKQQEQSLWTQIESLINKLNSSAEKLSDLDTLKSFSKSISDDDILDITVDSSAYEGSHSIEIQQLATSERLVHSGLKYDTDFVQSGNFIYTYDNKEVILNVPEQTTLEELVGLINNDDKNPGVTASIMKYDDGSDGVYHLVLSGRDSGTNYEININTSNSQSYISETFKIENDKNASLSTKLSDLTGVEGTFSSSGTADQIRIQGLSHDGTAIDKSFSITEHTTIEQLINEINEAFEDVDGNPTAKASFEDGQIKIMDLTAGESQMELTSITFVQGENSTVSMTLPSFSMDGQAGGTTTSGMDSFTSPDAFIKTQVAQDSMIRVDGYPQDNWISSSTNSVTGVIDGVTLNLHDVTDEGEEVKIGLSRDTNKLKTSVNNFINSYNELADYLKDKSGYDEETGIAGPLLCDSTVRDILMQIREPLFGSVTGFNSEDDPFSIASQIGLEINSDGLIELDSDVFNDALSEDYDAVFDLVGVTGKARITSGDSDYFVFKSTQDYTEAGDYEIKVEYDLEGNRAAYIRKSGGTVWRNATIDGNKIMGSLEGKDAAGDYYPERGLVVSFDPPESPAGTYQIELSIRQGISGDFVDILETYVDGDDCQLAIKKNIISDSLKSLEDTIEDEQDRLEDKEADLKAQYARLEATLQSLQQQMAASGLLSYQTL